jgi:hypothetical protein
MNLPASPQIGRRRQPGQSIRRVALKVRDIVAECVYAHRRMTDLASAPGRYLFDADAAPDTYAEFLFRTSGGLRHEPPARCRTGR